jgi:cytoskeletal protein RodZ
MIKELSLAVIFGLLIGFGLTGTFYFVEQNKGSNKNTPNIVAPSPSPDSQTNTNPTPTIALATSNFEITSPQNNDIISTSKVTLKGTTTPNSLIVITTPLKNYHLNANAQGIFSQIIDLEPGYNAINLTALDQNDQESHLEIFLTYSTTKLE